MSLAPRLAALRVYRGAIIRSARNGNDLLVMIALLIRPAFDDLQLL